MYSHNGNGLLISEKKEESETSGAPTESDGIIPRAVFDLFQTIERETNNNKKISVEMSFLEIYNEEARDLLTTENSQNNLFIREGADG
eukprot:scaffold5959_cov57-Cylindrotheca_fusiformis.AAC.1